MPNYDFHPEGAQSASWKGSTAKYAAMHMRVATVRGKADHCIHRNALGCTNPHFQWARIHGLPVDDVWNYVPLCQSCHRMYDGPLSFSVRWEIVRKHEEGVPVKALEREYGIHNSTIYRILQKW
jgi:hypothetical protein